MNETETIFYSSPVGTLKLEASPIGLQVLKFVEAAPATTPIGDILKKTVDQLDQYFAGELREFDVLLDPIGTEFQQTVWSALLEIPYGTTRTYLDIANVLGDSSATRAVGTANGRNKIAIIIPCHRIIGSDGSLTGFSGGLPRKKHLLELEGFLAKQTSLF